MNDDGILVNDTAYIITGERLEYIFNQLICDEIWFAFKKFYMGGGIEKEFKLNNLLNLPIPLKRNRLYFTEKEINYIKSCIYDTSSSVKE